MNSEYLIRECLEAFGVPHPNAVALKRVHGVMSLRQILRSGAGRRPRSWSQMATLFGIHTGRRYTRGTICTWAKCERTADLPNGYWKYRYMPDAVVSEWHTLLELLGSIGGYEVTVANKRTWRVKCRRKSTTPKPPA